MADNLDKTPIFYAVETGNVKAVDILLKYKAEANWIDCYGRTPLYYSVMQESSTILEKLLHGGANPDLYGCPNDSVEH